MAIIKEHRIKGEVYVEGYFVQMKHLAQLVRDFEPDCRDGFVSNDEAYIETRLKEMDYE